MTNNVTAMDPRIGTIVREGTTLFYAFIDGVLREGSREHIECLLGIK